MFETKEKIKQMKVTGIVDFSMFTEEEKKMLLKLSREMYISAKRHLNNNSFTYITDKHERQKCFHETGCKISAFECLAELIDIYIINNSVSAEDFVEQKEYEEWIEEF